MSKKNFPSLIPARTRGEIRCRWIATGDKNQPLDCIWRDEEASAAGEFQSSDDDAGLSLCA